MQPPFPPCRLVSRLLRLAAAWLAAALVMQALQGAMALGAGPRHTHATLSQGVTGSGHVHANLERHHHAMGDATVQRSGDDTLDAASLALTLALALMAFDKVLHRVSVAARVLRAAPLWFWSSRTLQPLRRPPRAA